MEDKELKESEAAYDSDWVAAISFKELTTSETVEASD